MKSYFCTSNFAPMKRSLIVLFACASCFSLRAQTLQDAIRLSENEQFESATAAFDALLEKDPVNGDAWFFKGENFFKAENFEAAEKSYTMGIQKAPTNALNYIGLGKTKYRDPGKASKADSLYQKALRMANAKSALPLIKIAEAYTNAPEKNPTAAEALLLQALKLEPKNAEVYLVYGDYFLEKGEGSKAIEQYNKARDLDPKSVKAILRQGQLYGKAKNYTLAFQKYQEAAQIDSSFAPAYREQGELYYLSKNYEKAKLKYNRYLELAGNQISARIRYASFLFLNKDYEESIRQFSEIIQIDSSRNYVNRLLAYACYEKADYFTGMFHITTFFRRAEAEQSKILPTDYEYRGKLRIKSGEELAGVEDLLKSLEMDSSKTELYGELAAGYFKSKNYSEAIYYYSIKIQKGKGTGNDWFKIGQANYYLKEFVKADSAFMKVIELQPKLPVGYFWRGRANAQLDPDSKLGLAKEHYEAFIASVTDPVKSAKDLVEAYRYLGFYHYVQKDNAKSKEAWLKVQELDPANEQAKKALEALK